LQIALEVISDTKIIISYLYIQYIYNIEKILI